MQFNTQIELVEQKQDQKKKRWHSFCSQNANRFVFHCGNSIYFFTFAHWEDGHTEGKTEHKSASHLIIVCIGKLRKGTKK